MSYKQIHEQIAFSEKHAELVFSPGLLWTMMLPQTDCKGRFSADPRIIKSRCLPLFETTRLEQVSEALSELNRIGLVHLFDSGAKCYLAYHDAQEWGAAGNLRNQRPKWPSPPPGLCRCIDDPTAYQRREYGVLSDSSSDSSSDSIGGKEIQEPLGGTVPAVLVPDGSLGYLQSVARSQSILGAVQSVNTAVAGWRTRYGAEKCLEMLMNNGGKSWLEIDKIYAPQPNGKPKVVDTNPRPKPVKQANCKACDTTGLKMLKQTMKDGSRIDVATKCPECQ